MKCKKCQARKSDFAGFCCFCENTEQTNKKSHADQFWNSDLEILNKCRVNAGLKPLEKMPKVSIN